MSNKGSSRDKAETVSEYEAKAMLRKFGINTPRGILVKELPEKLNLHFPLVMKVSDPNILHKTDVGGVKLGIMNKESLVEEFKAMKKKFPGSEFMIEETAPPGIEFIVGVTLDPVFGKVLMLGSGGIYTELYKDVTFRKLPVNREDAMDMIQGIRSKEFCNGFRGITIDCNMLIDMILEISDLATSSEYRIETMDINPIIVSQDTAVAVDAKLSFLKQPRKR